MRSNNTYRAELFLLATLSVGAVADAQRLPTTVVPEHYSLWFSPDFTKDTFRGTDRIDVQVSRATRSVTLHAAEIDFGPVSITAGGHSQKATVALDGKNETATLTVRSEERRVGKECRSR